jgi:D-alanine-D-alanine ligase
MKRPVTGKRIGVIAGGVSAEREVSLNSGKAVFSALMQGGYNAVFIDADKDLCESIIAEKIEVAFLVLHGGWGEDGSIQGMLEVMSIPYTGSGVLASALAMDKVISRKLFSQAGLRVPAYEVITESGKSSVLDTVSGISPPWVVKPAGEGSSVGVDIVDSEDGLLKAVNEAMTYGPKVIVERYIQGREVQIGILGGRALGGVEVRPKRRFYDFQAKYKKGLTDYIIPPELDDETFEASKVTALIAHNALGCEGATRVDLMIDEKGDDYILEVNTIPGMSETSLLPKIAMHAGYSFTELLEEILLEALKGNPGD